MKKLLIFVLVIVLTILIYKSQNTKKNIIVLGDNTVYSLKKYKNFSKNVDYRIVDLISDINNNEKITYNNKEYTYQNLLIKSDKLVFSIGINDLIYIKNVNINKYEYIDNLLVDLEDLFKLIRKYNKEQIYFVNYYNILEDKYIIYLNKRIEDIVKDYNINIIDISKINIEEVYPNDVESENIVKIVESYLLK